MKLGARHLDDAKVKRVWTDSKGRVYAQLTSGMVLRITEKEKEKESEHDSF
jgi:hypothetical protein